MGLVVLGGVVGGVEVPSVWNLCRYSEQRKTTGVICVKTE